MRIFRMLTSLTKLQRNLKCEISFFFSLDDRQQTDTQTWQPDRIQLVANFNKHMLSLFQCFRRIYMCSLIHTEYQDQQRRKEIEKKKQHSRWWLYIKDLQSNVNARHNRENYYYLYNQLCLHSLVLFCCCCCRFFLLRLNDWNKTEELFVWI